MASSDGGARTSWVLDFLPSWVNRLPADLIIVAHWTLLTVAVILLPVINETAIRVVLGVPFLLFIPGYVTVAVVFPEAGERPAADVSENTEAAGPGIDGFERLALSFGLSLALCALIVLALNFTPLGTQLVSVVVGIGSFSFITTIVAAQYRQKLSPDKRFRVPYLFWIEVVKDKASDFDTRYDYFLTGMLVISVLLATASIGYAITGPHGEESFSELYLLTEQDQGELAPVNYPTEFVSGQSRPIVVGIGNREHEQIRYTIVIEIQSVELQGPNRMQTRIQGQEELERFETRLAHNQTHHRKVNLQPTMTGQQLRIVFLLFRGGAPSDPSIESSYHHSQHWVNVTG